MKAIALIILILAIILIILPASAVRLNLQDYDWTGISFQDGAGHVLTQPLIINFSSGQVGATLNDNLYAYTTTPAAFTYAAMDVYNCSPIVVSQIGLYDSSWGVLDSLSYPNATVSCGRLEVKLIGMSPTYFWNGQQIASHAPISVNPSNLRLITYKSVMDNILVAEADHHVIGAPASNSSIIRDFFNPANNGYWMLATNGTAWIGPKNSFNVFADADTDSQDGVDSETLVIRNVQTGTIINSTVIDSSIPRHEIVYNIADLLAPGTSVVPDGVYSIGYEGSTVIGYLTIYSNGGWISFDRSTYNIGDTGAMSWYLSSSYIDLSTYTYTYQIIDISGNVKASGVTATTNTDTSGTVAITFSDGTYQQGAYFAQMLATNKLTGHVNVMGATAITITDYLNFYGHAYNAQTCAVLSDAQLNFTQGTTVNKYVTTADGNYSTTGYLTGAALTFNASKSGYIPYGYTINPLGARNVSLDFALIPSPTNTTGIAIGGVARSTTYGQLVPGATVYVWNITTGEFHTRTTNACGYYFCDDGSLCSLVSQRPYNVQGNATGYAASGIYGVTTS